MMISIYFVNSNLIKNKNTLNFPGLNDNCFALKPIFTNLFENRDWTSYRFFQNLHNTPLHSLLLKLFNILKVTPC